MGRNKKVSKSQSQHTTSKDLPKVERLLQCMMLLIDNEEHMRYSIEDIAQRLNTSPRTIYRYIRTLSNVGFVIPRPVHNVFHISKESKALETISKAIYFSDDERKLLSAALEGLADNSTTQNLRQKIERTYRQTTMAAIMSTSRLSENITNLQAAISGRLQVTLKNYRSGHSASVTDRIVEPFEISSEADEVTALEVSSKLIKVFKVTRIGRVEINNLEWQYADLHRHQKTDIFKFAGELKYPLRMTLSAYAADILEHEYPLSKSFLEPTMDGRYRLDTKVCEYTAAARFALGMMEHIEICECPQFLEYITNKIEDFNQKLSCWKNSNNNRTK